MEKDEGEKSVPSWYAVMTSSNLEYKDVLVRTGLLISILSIFQTIRKDSHSPRTLCLKAADAHSGFF